MEKVLAILLVDDDKDDRDIFIETITEFDSSIDCLVACNGEEGLRILENNLFSLPDYIFLDLNMPKMNGKQCLIKLKNNDAFKTIPVIIYTTSSSPEEIEDTMKLGAAYFLTKPSTISELRSEIQGILKKNASKLN